MAASSPLPSMLRITELRLPLDHPPDALRAAIVARLAIAPAELRSFAVFRQGIDARRKQAIVVSYTVDCGVLNEAEVLARSADDRHLRPAPDMEYRPVRLPADFRIDEATRPVVIGFGPCGIFAALVLA